MSFTGVIRFARWTRIPARGALPRSPDRASAACAAVRPRTSRLALGSDVLEELEAVHFRHLPGRSQSRWAVHFRACRSHAAPRTDVTRVQKRSSDFAAGTIANQGMNEPPQERED